MSDIKSSYEIALEKMKSMGMESMPELSESEKLQIEELRTLYKAKIAEKEILLKDQPELAEEIRFLEQERDNKIESVRNRRNR